MPWGHDVIVTNEKIVAWIIPVVGKDVEQLELLCITSGM